MTTKASAGYTLFGVTVKPENCHLDISSGAVRFMGTDISHVLALSDYQKLLCGDSINVEIDVGFRRIEKKVASVVRDSLGVPLEPETWEDEWEITEVLFVDYEGAATEVTESEELKTFLIERLRAE